MVKLKIHLCRQALVDIASLGLSSVAQSLKIRIQTIDVEYQTVLIYILVGGKIDIIHAGLLRFLVFWSTEVYRRRPSILSSYFVKAVLRSELLSEDQNVNLTL